VNLQKLLSFRLDKQPGESHLALDGKKVVAALHLLHLHKIFQAHKNELGAHAAKVTQLFFSFTAFTS